MKLMEMINYVFVYEIHVSKNSIKHWTIINIVI